GDVRANDNPALASLHTLLVREHNRRADELALADSNLTGEQLYQLSRRWVSAILQQITYNEFLPLLLGESALPAYSGYDETVDPAISALFSGAAFRFGHSLASSEMVLLDENNDPLAESPLSLRDAFFNPEPLKDHGIEPLLRGLTTQVVEELDAQVIDDLRNFLFGPPGAGGLDLTSLNIQRGRDLGLPSYNDTRRELGLDAAQDFSDLTNDASVQARLASVYSDVEQVDLWVGGLAEDHATGAVVGETFASIIADQFTRLRDGDRFWFENQQFNAADLAAIRATTMSALIQRNTSITTLPASVFTTQTAPAGFGTGGAANASDPTENRTIDGHGNNVAMPGVGQVGTNLRTDFTPAYADGISQPAGPNRPNAREISNAVFAQTSPTTNADGITHLFMIWGQLLTHDTNLTPGGTDNTLRIHGESAPTSDAYPFVAEKLPLMLEHEVYVGFNNVLDRPIYLPKLDVAGGTDINPSQETMVDQQIAPGEMVSIQVAAGTLEDRDGTMFDGTLSITEVPPELTPAALPTNLIPDLVVTIQPANMVFSQPTPVTFPNRSGWAPGEPMDLWSINPETGEFEDVGDMRVSSDGLRIETISGGINNTSWGFPARPPIAIRDSMLETATPEESCPTTDCNHNSAAQTKRPGSGQANAPGTSVVELHSGAVIEMHELVSYYSLGQQRGLTLFYDSQRADPRPIIHFGADNVLADPDQRLVARLQFERGGTTTEVPGFAGGMGLPGGEHFWAIPDGGGNLQAALQGDLRGQPSGVYRYTLSTGILRLDDGQFSGAMSESSGQVVHVNAIDSPFGSGWQLAGVQQLVENPDGSLLFSDGDGANYVFGARPTAGEPYVSPPGDYSTLVKNTDGAFTRTMTDQTLYQFDVAGRL
ncbi:MAG: hypothetical protein KDA47_05115, partial [Planctomycetales bacterium]|nr:hypothetical protein [Planctomycetales bacterium]